MASVPEPTGVIRCGLSTLQCAIGLQACLNGQLGPRKSHEKLDARAARNRERERVGRYSRPWMTSAC
jgi:hypothetical protein